MKVITSKLIKLAAEMAMCCNMPSPCVEDWSFSKNITRKDALAVLKASSEAERQCKKWAVRLRNIVGDIDDI